MKLRNILLSILLLGCLASCTNNSSNISNGTQTSQDNRVLISNLDEMCSYLEKQKVVSGDKKEMSAAAIGAISGIKYTNYDLEIYVYTNDAPTSFQIFGIDMNFDAINGKFALVFSSGSEKDTTIIDCFKNARTK